MSTTTSARPTSITSTPPIRPSRTRARLRSLTLTLLVHAAVLSIVFAVWWWLTDQRVLSPLILPPPLEVAEAWADITAGSGLVWKHVGVTLLEASLGFTLGSAAAAAVAISAALSTRFRTLAYPYIIAFQVTPRIAVAPIIIAALGFGLAPKVAIAATICFFPVLLNMLTGLLSIDPSAEEMFRSIGASRFKTFTKLMLPTSMPFTMAGLQTGVSFALIGVIVAEFISASAGLGFLTKKFSFELNMAASYAVVIWLTIMGLVLFALLKLATRYIVYWESDAGLTAHSSRHAKRLANHPFSG